MLTPLLRRKRLVKMMRKKEKKRVTKGRRKVTRRKATGRKLMRKDESWVMR